MPAAEHTPAHVAAVQHLWYGHDHVPAKSDYAFSLKAVKALAAGDGELSEPERRHLLGKMCAILAPPDVVDEVMRFDEHSESPERLLDGVQVPAEVRPGTGAWIVYEALSVASSDGDLAAAELDGIRRVASTMGVQQTIVDQLTALVRDEASMRDRRIQLLNSTIPTAFRFAHAPAEQRRQPVATTP